MLTDRQMAMVGGVAALVALPLVHNMHRNALVWRAAPPDEESQLYLPEGDSLRLVTFGNELLMADLFWLRAVSLFGEREGDGGDTRWFSQLYHLIDLTTDLDPRFASPYRLGGQMLHADRGHIEHSNFVFYKGMQAIPDEFWFPFSIGMSYLIDFNDRISAAPYVQAASECPDAPFYLKNLAASVLTDTGSLDLAIHFLEEQLPNARPGVELSALQVKLPELYHERAGRALEAAHARFVEAEGREPNSVEELLTSGSIDEVPEDPLVECGCCTDPEPSWVKVGRLDDDGLQMRYESSCREDWLLWVHQERGLGSALRTLDPFRMSEGEGEGEGH